MWSGVRMSFNWTEYLTLAQTLAQQAPGSPTPEALLRSAISRAYYAAFIQARNRLRDVERRPVPRRDVHEYVIRQFTNSRDYKRQKVGKNLVRLREHRTRADYDNILADLN